MPIDEVLGLRSYFFYFLGVCGGGGRCRGLGKWGIGLF